MYEPAWQGTLWSGKDKDTMPCIRPMHKGVISEPYNAGADSDVVRNDNVNGNARCNSLSSVSNRCEKS